MILFIILKELPAFIAGGICFAFLNQGAFVDNNSFLDTLSVCIMTFFIHVVLSLTVSWIIMMLKFEEKFLKNEDSNEEIVSTNETLSDSEIDRIGIFKTIRSLQLTVYDIDDNSVSLQFNPGKKFEIVEYRVSMNAKNLIQKIRYRDEHNVIQSYFMNSNQLISCLELRIITLREIL